MTSEVELPLPVPDVPGADAGAAGLPHRSEFEVVMDVAGTDAKQ